MQTGVVGMMRFPSLPPKRRALLAVAANPGAPEDVLLRLLSVEHGRMQVARYCTDITPRLRERLLASGDTLTLCAVARNRALPLAVRRELGSHPDTEVRAAAVGRYPGLSDGTDRAGLLEMFRAAARDEVVEVRVALADNANVPQEIVGQLASDPAPEVRAALAGSMYRAELAPVWRSLLTDPDGSVRVAAVSNGWFPPIPADLSTGLLTDPLTRVRALHNGSSHLSAALADGFAADPDDDIRSSLAVHPMLPARLVPVLVADRSAHVRAGIALRRDISEELRGELTAQIGLRGENTPDIPSSDEDFDREFARACLSFGWMSSEMCWMSEVSPDAGAAYLASPHAFLRRAAVSRAPLAPDVLETLFEDADLQVASLAAVHHPDPPGEVLERLYVARGAGVKPHIPLLDHRNFPRAAFTRFAGHPDARVRAAACRDPQLPAALVGELAADPEPFVRAAAAGHPNLPERLIPVLLEDDGSSVPESLGASPALTVGWMHRLLDSA